MNLKVSRVLLWLLGCECWAVNDCAAKGLTRVCEIFARWIGGMLLSSLITEEFFFCDDGAMAIENFGGKSN